MNVTKRKFVKRLNNDWEVYVSAKYPDKYFYFNLRTGETTWEPPDPTEDVQIKQEKVSDDSDTDPGYVVERFGSTSRNRDTKSPDNPHEERNIKLIKEDCCPVPRPDMSPTLQHPNSSGKKEQKFLQPAYHETMPSSLVSSDNTHYLNHRHTMKRNSPNCNQGRSGVQGSGKVKLKRRWAESENSSGFCEQDSAKKQNVATRGSDLSIERVSHEATASGSTLANDNAKHSRLNECDDNVRRISPVAGIAEKRLLHLRKSLEKQRTQLSKKSSPISAVSAPGKRVPKTGNISVPDRSYISPTQNTKQCERFTPIRGSPKAAKTAVAERHGKSSTQNITTKRVSPVQGPTHKKNIAANRLKFLQERLSKEQKQILQGKQNKNVQSKKPICVVTHDSHKTKDEVEFLEAEEQMLMDVQELREEIHKAGGVNPEEIEEMICEIIPSSFPDTKSNVYIVSDTNVLVSNFQSIDRLCNTNVEGVGYPVFIIPWMVLHELDILKDRRDVTKSKLTAVHAQKAIKFLHGCFSTKHPRVIGQTVSDAGPNALSGLCNPDNSILQCCLQQMKLGRRVVLLSDDKNLQNKCMVNGVDAVGKSNLKNYLQTLSKQNKNEPKTANTVTANAGPSTFEEPTSKVNILITNLMYCAKEVLSKIILQEMKNAYGDKWLVVICVKPPFSLNDIFTCLMRHWIAVFGLVMSKNSLATVKELKKLSESNVGNDAGSEMSVEDVKNITIKFARLLSEFVKPLYNKLIKEAQTYLEHLISDCENPFSRSELKNAVSFSEPSTDWVVSKHSNVVDNIRKIWLALVELCQRLRMAIAHDQSSIQMGPHVVLSEEELKTWVSYFYGPVSNLYLIMESVTTAKEAQTVHLTEMTPVMDQMYKDFCEMYKLISSGQQIGFSIEDMISFCGDCETSDVFKEIKEQFHNFGVIMRQAIDYFSEKDLVPFSNNNSANNSTSPDDVEMEEQFSDGKSS